MLIAPCSVRTMSEIATGVTSTLLTRAADVVLKERRRLVLMVRETPLHTGHLRTMTALSEMGAVIAPPVPAFYTGATDPRRLCHAERRSRPGPVRISDTPIQRWQG
jgi:4-hydroxy-3-polyprenylbenzoate decarboxylase